MGSRSTACADAPRSRCLQGIPPVRRRPAHRPSDRGTTRFRPPRRRRPPAMQVVRLTSALNPAHPDDRDARPARGPRRPGRARSRGPPGRTRRRSRRRATARRAGADGSAMPRSVLMSETASAPCASAAAATSAGDVQFGVSFTISGLRGERAHARRAARAVSPGSAPMTMPVFDVRAGDVELERGDLVALGERRHELGDLLAGEAHDVDDQRHRQLGELRQVVLEVAVEALVRQPDRVDHAAGQLPQPRRRVALRAARA